MALPSAVVTISKGIDLVRQLIDLAMSAVEVTVDNFTRWTIKINALELFDGDFDNKTGKIPEAHKGGWIGCQLPEHDRTEGFATLTMSTHIYCVAYCRVEHPFAGRKPNALGVGCMPINHTCQSNLCDDDWDSEIATALEGSNYVSDYLQLQEFSTSVPVIEHCNDIVCIQGTMGVGQRAKIFIDVFPLNVTDVAPSLNGTLTQEIINDSTDAVNFIEPGKPRKRRKKDTLSGGAIAGIVVASVVVLVIIIAVVVIKSKS